jgi:hypothetical protein
MKYSMVGLFVCLAGCFHAVSPTPATDGGSTKPPGSDSGTGSPDSGPPFDAGLACTGVAPGLLDSTGQVYTVSPNQNFVGIWTTPNPQNLNTCGTQTLADHIGTLELLSVCDGNRVTLATDAQENSLVFSNDGSSLAFIGGATDECSQNGWLELAAGDGTGLRRVTPTGSTGYTFAPNIVGGMAFFDEVDGGINATAGAAPLAGGPAVDLGFSRLYFSAVRPDGTAVVVSQNTGGLVLVDALTGAATPLVTGSGAMWSPDGTLIAISTSAAPSSNVSLFTAAGAHVSDLPEGDILTMQSQAAVAFSPDGTRVAYVTQDAGEMGMVVRTLATGQDSLLGSVPAPDAGNMNWGCAQGAVLDEVTWSPDQAFVFARVSRGCIPPDFLYAGSVSGGLVELSGNAEGTWSLSPTDDLVAVELWNGSSAVLASPATGAVQDTISAYGPYAPDPTDSPLLATNGTGQLQLYPHDGTGSPVTLPGLLDGTLSPIWVSPSLALYTTCATACQAGVYPTLFSVDVDGNTQTVATGVFSIVSPPTARRVFYTRYGQGEVQANGLWMVDL